MISFLRTILISIAIIMIFQGNASADSLMYEYDSAGRIKNIILPTGYRIQHNYDSNGNLIGKFKRESLCRIDPINGDISGEHEITGWSLDKTGVIELVIFIDDLEVGKPQYGLLREDVYNQYPIYTNRNAGFNFVFNTDLLFEGKHTIKVLSYGSAGKTTECETTINISKNYISDNLLHNDSFESDKAFWSEWNANNKGQVNIVRAPVAEGEKAIKISTDNMGIGDVSMIWQQISVEPNKLFQASSNFIVEKIQGSSIELYIEFWRNGTEIIDVYPVFIKNTTGGAYTTLSTNGTTPPGAQFARIYALVRSTSANNSGIIFVDSMSFHYVKNMNINKLYNGGFEEALDNWTQWSSISNAKSEVTNMISDSGNRSLSMQAADMANNDVSYVFQQLQVSPNKSYHASGRFKVDLIENARAELYVEFWKSATEISAVQLAYISTESNGMFKTLQATGQTPPDTSFVRIYGLIRATSNQGIGHIYIDSMKYTEF